MKSLKHSPKITLRNGIEMPVFGLGTSNIPIEKTKEIVVEAVKMGYRLIDTANDYGNEVQIGEAIKELIEQKIVTREELFIQCKLFGGNKRKEWVKADLEATLEDLQVDYVDSYIMHWPQAIPGDGSRPLLNRHGNRLAPESEKTMFPVDEEGYYTVDINAHYMEAWHAMEDLAEKGLARSIGLSNFNIQQIRRVLQKSKKFKPCLIQSERHPYFQNKDVVDFCRNHNIVFQAFTPLGSPQAEIMEGFDRVTPGCEIFKEKSICNISFNNDSIFFINLC